MRPWDWKILVPIMNWEAPAPTLTGFLPGHDARLISNVGPGEQETIEIEFQFDQDMDCDSVADSLVTASTTEDSQTAELDRGSIICESLDEDPPEYVGQPASGWHFVANLTKVLDGVHTVTINNATNANKTVATGVSDPSSWFTFMLTHLRLEIASCSESDKLITQ